MLECPSMHTTLAILAKSAEPDASAADFPARPASPFEFDANALFLQEPQGIGNFEAADSAGSFRYRIITRVFA